VDGNILYLVLLSLDIELTTTLAVVLQCSDILSVSQDFIVLYHKQLRKHKRADRHTVHWCCKMCNITGLLKIPLETY
jgi:hypothetical protein